MPEFLSRRAFLASSASLARNSCIVLTLPMILTACERAQEARLRGDAFRTLTEVDANELAAIAARIVPTDTTPGATEAGVVYFMDNVLGDKREQELEFIRAGVRELQTAAALEFNAPYFYLLDSAQQDQLLTAIEATEFFASVRFLTVAGMFALPEYGGSADKIGNQLIGFEDRHAWVPPFGFYDADFSARGE
ncbi:MAG: gluconate 2-dehydrogenase subunit 3 family protein [Gammaproteobacteria bacterium]|nr:gluconate 2-dehydrogenase subunit 3 family protein [Gammaproteobacteria bacterium]